MIQEVWILDLKSGRNIFHRCYGEEISDPDLLTSFLTAFYRFAEELSERPDFVDKIIEINAIESIEMGGLKWIYNKDVNLLYIAAAEMDDSTHEIRAQLEVIRKSFNDAYDFVLDPTFPDTWNGNTSQFEKFAEKIDELHEDWKKALRITKAAELMDLIEVYQQILHLLSKVSHAIKKGKEEILDQKMRMLKELLPKSFKDVKYTERGWDLLGLNVLQQELDETELRGGLSQIFRFYVDLMKDIFKDDMKEIISKLIFPYMRKDWDRIRKLNLDKELIENFLIS
ncbi:MAG: hypothetical protein ACXQS8_02750 [Candidatus Helarchaeales archaeon]